MNPGDPLANGRVPDNVLLQDAFAALRGDLAVPDALGINEQPRTADADPETAGLGAHDRQFQLGATALEIIPGRLAFRRRRAIGAETKEKMTPGTVEIPNTAKTAIMKM